MLHLHSRIVALTTSELAKASSTITTTLPVNIGTELWEIEIESLAVKMFGLNELCPGAIGFPPVHASR